MGRIADSAADLLAAGPLRAEDLGTALAGAGVTRSRDPAAAVRRALRGDPRFVLLPDGRLAVTAQALDERVDALDAEVAALLVDERFAEAALAQERLLVLLQRGAPERVPAARRGLARLLARSGAPERALARLRGAFAERDPEDWYEAALIAQRTGDHVSARRWAESGLAHAAAPERAEVAECLDDIAGDLDAQAAFLRLRATLEDEDGDIEPERDGIERVVRALTRPGALVPGRGDGRGDRRERAPGGARGASSGPWPRPRTAGATRASRWRPSSSPPWRARCATTSRAGPASAPPAPPSPGSWGPAPWPRGRPRPWTRPTSSRWS